VDDSHYEPEVAIAVGESRVGDLALQDDELLAEGQVLKHEPVAAQAGGPKAEQGPDRHGAGG
jgi:hypothetical protein